MKIHLNYIYDDIDLVTKKQIKEALDWLCHVLESDEFKWKARKYKERDLYLKNINGYSGNIRRLYPEGGLNSNKGALYNNETKTIKFNLKVASTYTKERLGALLGHEIGHQWFDHKEGDIGSFLGFIQYKTKFMKGRSNFYYKALLWVYSLFK